MNMRNLLTLLVVLLCLPMGVPAQDSTGKSAPARDPKSGQFVKKAEPGKSNPTANKKLPARDPKTGLFIKSDPAKSTSAKKLPARDPITGRFVKSSDSAKKPGDSVKKRPARDPKTGRFIKKP